MQLERTLVVVKPDGVKRRLIGKIIQRLEEAGLKLVALKMFTPSVDLVKSNYPESDEWFKKAGDRSINTFKEMGVNIEQKFGTDNPIEVGKIIKKWIVRFMTSGNVVAMVWEGNRAADNVRRLIGETDPLKAQPGTIRGDFSVDNVILGNSSNRPMANVVHASGNREEALTEIPLWFKSEEILRYTREGEDAFYKQW